MYNTGLITKGLSLTKIIGGISKTLQIANQVIPLYQKAKPMISNARSLFSIVKEIGSSSNKTTSNTSIPTNKTISTKKEIQKKETTTSPTFFL